MVNSMLHALSFDSKTFMESPVVDELMLFRKDFVPGALSGPAALRSGPRINSVVHFLHHRRLTFVPANSSSVSTAPRLNFEASYQAYSNSI